MVGHGEGAEFAVSLARQGHQVWLVEQGIESISLNPDTVVSTWMMLANEPRQ